MTSAESTPAPIQGSDLDPSADPALFSDNNGQLDRFIYDDRTPRAFLWATYIWGLVAFLVGLIAACLLFMPTLMAWAAEPTDPGGAAFFVAIAKFVVAPLVWLYVTVFEGTPYLSFARLRPLHTNAAIFAFAGNGIFAAIYYSTQRLCKARMWSDTLSRCHFWGWQLIIVAAAITLPLGITQSKEYAELEWPIDLLIAVVWVGFFGVNFFMTLIKRRERHLYVALWFYIATIVTVAVLHVFNNLAFPVLSGTTIKSYPIYAGVQDAMMQWWYGHNAVAFFLTTPFLGLMYYFLPKAAERPVFSYRLSILHFWSLVFIYIWAGPHHLHYTSLPQWAQSLGMVFSVMLWMPSWGGMINGLLTLRGAWHKVTSDPVLKFFVVGITFYGMSTFEGPLLSIKAVNSLSHYTDWTIGHVHSGALGWNGFMVFGMMYWLAPRLFQTELYSNKLASAHFWTATIGILLYVISMYVAGITQGLMWRALTPTGQLQYASFVETTMAIMPMYGIRALGGTLFLVGALLGGVNLIMTWRNRPKTYDQPVHYAPRLQKIVGRPEQPPKSELTGVMEFAKWLDVWNSLWWHRVWERMPIRLTLMVTLAVAIASLAELIPTFVIRSNVPTIATVKPYTPLELAGRDIYVSEGCYNCHSQQIRPIVGETLRYGEYSKPGESVYDRPFQWGSRRIGPDLSREGGRQNELWHVAHFDKPQEITPGSIMPPYTWLLREELDFESIPVRVAAIRALHPMDANFDDYPMGDAAVEHARAQADVILAKLEAQNGGPYATTYRPVAGSTVGAVEATAFVEADAKVIALVAYMQRLGVDLFAEPDHDPFALETPTVDDAPEATSEPTNQVGQADQASQEAEEGGL